MTVTLTTIIKNAAELLPEMIRSARPVVDEFVLVIDSGTTDNTRDLARQMGAKTVEFDWCDDFAKARNFGIEHSHGEWILVLDADDRLLPLGVTVIRKVVGWGMGRLREWGVVGYQFLIEERTLDGQVMAHTFSSGRIFPRRNSLRYVGRAHEEIQYLPNPSATRWAEVSQQPLMYHVGQDPRFMPEKWARNERLLRMRIDEEPDNPWPHWYLARQFLARGMPAEARMEADAALRLGDGKLLKEHREGMEAILRA